MDEVKFPFKPSERARAAFRQERQRKAAIKLMTEALAEVASDITEPFEVLVQDHPELMEYRWYGMSFNHLTQELDIKPNSHK